MNSFKKMVLCCLMLLTVFALHPRFASAYSYGNPNEEAVAEVYKKVVASLNQNPPDYAAARASFETIKGELDMHMGKEPGMAIQQALEGKNKDAAIDAFQKTLVLNIARRLDNVESDFTNYKQAKLLLAKGLATYDALSPVVASKSPDLDQTMRKDFDAALQALGNPGLFGVGVKQPDKALFTEKKAEILTNLQKQFQLPSLEVGHFSAGEGPDNPLNQSNPSSGFGEWKNWLPIIVILAVLTVIVVRTMRKRRT